MKLAPCIVAWLVSMLLKLLTLVQVQQGKLINLHDPYQHRHALEPARPPVAP